MLNLAILTPEKVLNFACFRPEKVLNSKVRFRPLFAASLPRAGLDDKHPALCRELGVMGEKN